MQDTTWYVTMCGNAQPDPAYMSNAEETDTQLWLHVRRSPSEKKSHYVTRHRHISYSTTSSSCRAERYYSTNKPIQFQKSKIHPSVSIRHCFKLPRSMQSTPDSDSSSDSNNICSYMLRLHIFFQHDWESYIFRYFFQYAEFIKSGSKRTPGTLGDIGLDIAEMKKGFLAFLRLVGTAYFKKHALGFTTPSPQTLFNKHYDPTTTPLKQHDAWLSDIRQNI